MDCDDEDPCTDDTCLDGGCLHIPGVAPCDDGDPCTVRDACSGGACAGEPRDCDDGEECTYDVCSGEAGCTYTPVEGPCDDEDLCTEENTCDEGACVGVAVECDDLNACTQSSCDPAVGCVHTVVAGACDDGERCTEGDACSHGVCMPGSWDEALEGCERGSCGNRICANDESCLSCPADCGPCCGDGACVAAFGESCGTCAIDCALCPGCANGACEPELGEDCETCAQDCGPCADACLPISTVACGQTVKDSLNSGETTDVIGSYACDEVAGVNHIGPERAFILGAACDGVVRVNLRRTGGQGGLLDLVVLDGWRPCRGQACVAAGVMDSPEQDRGVAELRFLGWSQHPYLVVVDGAVGATGDFELNITCSCSIPAEVCSGGEDEDADGRTDCEDPECAASPPCTGVEPDCGDGRDEDMDGKTDCEDPDCAEAEGCE